MDAIIFKVCGRLEWAGAEAAGVYEGSQADARDGFIHFSTADQLPGTLEKHYAGQRDLVLIAVDAQALGDALKWEPSRGGGLFPHLYGPLPLAAVRSTQPLAEADDGCHVVPDLSA